MKPRGGPRALEGPHVSFQDKTLTCRDCGQEFIWTAGEQEFYASRGLQNAPTRCPADRAARRAQGGGRGGGGGYAGGGGGGGYGGGGGGYGGQREMFTATCSNCGREARVPFQPRGDRPASCSDCFEQRRPARRSQLPKQKGPKRDKQEKNRIAALKQQKARRGGRNPDRPR